MIYNHETDIVKKKASARYSQTDCSLDYYYGDSTYWAALGRGWDDPEPAVKLPTVGDQESRYNNAQKQSENDTVQFRQNVIS